MSEINYGTVMMGLGNIGLVVGLKFFDAFTLALICSVAGMVIGRDDLHEAIIEITM